MKKFRYLINFISLCFVLVNTNSYSGTVSSTDKTIKIRLWNIPAKGARDANGKANRAVYEQFLKTHPQVKIEPASGITVGGTQQEAGWLMAMAGGIAPDATPLYFRLVQNYAEQNFLYPLDEYVNSWEGKKYIPQHLWDVVTHNGHIYGVPTEYYVLGIVYRRDLFISAGLDPDRPPSTWEEFYEYCKKLTQPEKGRYGFYIPTGFMAGWMWTSFVWQAGGDMVRFDKETNRWRAAFNEPPAVEALEFYQKLKWGKWSRNGREYKGVALSGPSFGGEEFARGKVAMMIDSYDALGSLVNGGLNPKQLGVGSLPSGPRGHRGNFIGGAVWSMNSQIKDKSVRDAAWEFIKYLANEDAVRLRTKIFIESGWAQFYRPDLLKRFGFDYYLRDIPNSWITGYNDLLKFGRVEPHCPNYQNIQTTELMLPIDHVLLYENTDPAKVLDTAAKRVNETLLGYQPPQIMNKRRIIVGILLVIMTGVFAVAFKKSLNILGGQARAAANVVQVKFGKNWLHKIVPWIFLLPCIASIAIWSYYPLFAGIRIAFYDYHIIGKSDFVGLDNFVNVLYQPMVWKAMYNTLIYVAMSLGLGFFLPIILAIFLTEIPRGKMLFRILFFLPSITSGLVIMIMWKRILDPTAFGYLNQLIGYLGIPPQTWLNDPKLAMLCIILTGLWGGVGPGCIIYLAAMKTIPEELYEAADIDGANIRHKLFGITFPTLKPLIIINFVGAFIGSFKAAEGIMVMTGGGPLNATHTIGLEIFYGAFLYIKFGYATAIAWILGALLIGFTVYQLKLLRNLKFTTVEKI